MYLALSEWTPAEGDFGAESRAVQLQVGSPFVLRLHTCTLLKNRVVEHKPWKPTAGYSSS